MKHWTVDLFRFVAVLYLFSAAVTDLRADVFSLWPFSGKGNLSSGASMHTALEGTDLWTENISLNGRKVDMQITLIERPLDEVISSLKKNHKNISAIAGNSNSLLFEIPLGSGGKRRCYLAAVAGTRSMLLFSMDLPKNFKAANTGALWPSALVLPPGAKPGTVMKFPGRKALYGQFESPYSAPEVISQMSTLLRNSRWKAVADDNHRLASGGLFLRDDSREILIFSVKEHSPASGKRGCSGTIYTRKLENSSSSFSF